MALADSATRGTRPIHLPYPASDLLRFSTAGSVDDGKSTLIGRLLHDSKGIFEDQLAALEVATRRRGGSGVDLALLTDGLRAEREQGITIDVAYRYFATPRRKFIVADTPGHLQYTRNMVTGCSTADLAVVLVDARAGVVEQTRRHIVIAALLGVPSLASRSTRWTSSATTRPCSTRSRQRFEHSPIASASRTWPPSRSRRCCGDNVVTKSPEMPWYDGAPLLEHLETVDPDPTETAGSLRLPIQWVIRDRARGSTTARSLDASSAAGSSRATRSSRSHQT